MATVILTSLFLKLIVALIALALVHFTLRWFDRRTGFRFSAWLNDADNTQKAFYLGARFFGVCAMFGLILSS